MLSLRSIFLGSLLSVLTAVEAAVIETKLDMVYKRQGPWPQFIQVGWSQHDFVTIPGTNGPEMSHGSGLVIMDEQGGLLAAFKNPGGGTDCAQHGGSYHTISSTCWDKDRIMWCVSDFAGNPSECAVLDCRDCTPGATGVGTTDHSFIGIALIEESYCGAQYALLPYETCDGDAEFTVTHSEHL